MVERFGDGVSGIEPGQIVAALPITGAYAEFICLPQRELVACNVDISSTISYSMRHGKWDGDE